MFKHNRLSAPEDAHPEAGSEPLGYGPTLPASFRVGATNTTPVVSVEEVQAHLKILGAFSRLKTRVSLAQEDNSATSLESDAAWTVFLCRAAHRFDRWVLSRPTRPAPWDIVPLDVFMVWHSFMLNPLSYEEDGCRILPQLQHLHTLPLLEVASLINSDTFDFNVMDAARQAFESATGTNFDPPLVTTSNESLAISCPACYQSTTFHWPWINDSGTGWAQRSFNCHCPTCNQYIDHESYGVRRFANDVAQWCVNARAPIKSRYKVNLAGATTTARMMQMNAFCWQIFKPILESRVKRTGADLAKSWKFKFDEIETQLMKFSLTRTGYDLVLQRLRRILSHYRHPGPFSVELTSAVMRQGSFIQKMVDLGWTNPMMFVTDKTILLRAIGRYHAFLDLMSSSPASFFVPTLDIDIVWHTHQLKALNYKMNTLQMLGFTPNHDDRVEENKLSNSFDLTSQAWRRRFGVPYSVCGCVAPAESSISRTIRSVKSRLPGSSQKRPTSLPPQLKNSRPDLVTFADDGAPDATHPSDHNAVIVVDNRKTLTVREEREERQMALHVRRAREVERGTADAWTELQHRRAQRETHDAAFFYPIPYWGVAPYQHGYYGYGGAACGSGGGRAASGDGVHGGVTAGDAALKVIVVEEYLEAPLEMKVGLQAAAEVAAVAEVAVADAVDAAGVEEMEVVVVVEVVAETVEVEVEVQAETEEDQAAMEVANASRE